MLHTLRLTLIAIFVAAWAPLGSAQWDPGNGFWGKSDPNEIRVMTWNIHDNIRTLEPKTEATNAWTGIATIVATLQPDVLLLQETGDNGCSGCVDSTAEVEDVLELFMHGGADPYLGGQVTAYVQKYAPGYDLPYIYACPRTDGYNRNAILSRFPFVDLNGDGMSFYPDLYGSLPDAYAPGTAGNQVIRGFQYVEIDLPDAVYKGDLVAGHAHLKSGSDSSSKEQRLRAGKNIAYMLDYWYNGAGTGAPDPNGKIFDSPVASLVLGSNTATVVGGDWNEDENTNSRKGPAEWIAVADVPDTSAGTDGTDRDRSDSTYDAATDPCSGQRGTVGFSTKFDYLCWTDSVATAVREFTFNSATISSGCGAMWPLELQNFPDGSGTPYRASTFASDHKPVTVDLVLPRKKNPDIYRNGRARRKP